MNITTDELAAEITHAKANGLFDAIAHAADQAGIPRAFQLAIATRETNLTNELGDGGHGVGVMQVDTQHPEAARWEATGEWRTPQGIAADAADGAQMLAGGIAYVDAGIARLNDPDAYDTGHDYGRDVVERMHAIEQILGAQATEPVAQLELLLAGQPVACHAAIEQGVLRVDARALIEALGYQLDTSKLTTAHQVAVTVVHAG